MSGNNRQWENAALIQHFDPLDPGRSFIRIHSSDTVGYPVRVMDRLILTHDAHYARNCYRALYKRRWPFTGFSCTILSMKPGHCEVWHPIAWLIRRFTERDNFFTDQPRTKFKLSNVELWSPSRNRGVFRVSFTVSIGNGRWKPVPIVLNVISNLPFWYILSDLNDSVGKLQSIGVGNRQVGNCNLASIDPNFSSLVQILSTRWLPFFTVQTLLPSKVRFAGTALDINPFGMVETPISFHNLNYYAG